LPPNLIHRGFPQAALAWAGTAFWPLVEHHPAVDGVILFDRHHWWNQYPFYGKFVPVVSIWSWIFNAAGGIITDGPAQIVRVFMT
jgi:hypothetical protein